MSNVRLIVDDAVQVAALTATSEAMPVDNLRTTRRSRPWRSTDLAVQTLTAVYPARSVRGLALSHHNLSADAVVTATFKHATATVAEITFPVTDRDTWVGWADETVVSDTCEVVIDDGDNGAGYVEVAQLVIGDAVTVTYNFALGARTLWREDVEHEYTAGQSLRSHGTRLVRREATISLARVARSDRDMLVRALLTHGQGAPLLLCLYPGAGGELEADHQFVAKRTSNLPPVQNAQEYFEMDIEFKEA